VSVFDEGANFGAEGISLARAAAMFQRIAIAGLTAAFA
jgi:hypothetical protein